MFELVSAPELQKKIKNLEKYYPPEVSQEVKHFLEILEKDGHLSKTNFYDINTNEISGLYSNIFYKPVLEENKVILIDIRMKAADIFRERFTIEDDWDDSNCIDSIPQYDKPKKIIQAILLIHQGITDSYELGQKLGHKGKKDIYISRHGQYAKQALEALKLITRTRQGKIMVTQLTQKGQLIAEAHNENLQERLLIEAMLSYPPVWRIIDAVSLKQSQLNNGLVLNDEVVKELTFPKEFQDADTSNRRSQTLKNWIKWISKKSGIPIYIHKEGVQLTIPMLFAEVIDGGDTE
ncbi:DUF7226 domain-containing protein [Anabaena azotica]|uniref:DUF7226 domain-containing protein n=1 Tax=Anabaena azotica FACHB-119 TaxID=947527 RepID=A0ABR8DDT0_9NOST|nr:hypothetical protein [Anabaena azotica]MBD2505092.1 hypothetical protein [Anabaena azotica FACHB-119]